MTKLEEVARAFYEALIRQESDHRRGGLDGFQELIDGKGGYGTLLDGRYDLVAAMRAAIEALKNPPDKALDAMNPSGRYASTVIPEAWNDAIDAILSEGE